MRWYQSLRARLFVGFLAVVSVFGISSWMTVASGRVLRRALEDARGEVEGIRASLDMANAAREGYVHVAHVIIDPHGLEHAEHVEDAQRAMARWKRVVEGRLTTLEERQAFAGVETALATFTRIYREEIVPGVAAGRHDRVRVAHAAIETALTALITANDALSDSFRVRIEATFRDSTDLVDRSTREGYALLVLATCLSAVLSLGTARSVVSPINVLLEGTGRISKGEFGHQVPIDDSGEIGVLARAMNAMSRELLKRCEELVRAEKLASIGRLAAGVAHELNNPLGVILGYVKTLQKEADPGSQLEDDLETVEGEVRQCQRIVQDLRALARPAHVDVDDVDVTGIIREELAKFTEACFLGRVRIDDRLPATLNGRADAGRLRQVVSNLLRNAVDAMPSGGSLVVRGGPSTSNLGRILVSISDTGVGIAPEARANLFEPFHTTKPHGMGLGLSISYAIMRSLDGELRAENNPDETSGACFVMELPHRLVETPRRGNS